MIVKRLAIALLAAATLLAAPFALPRESHLLSDVPAFDQQG